jgi:hypothetical protein
VLVAGREQPAPAANATAARERAHALLTQGLTRKDAAGRLVRELGLSRNDAYRLVTTGVKRET